MADANHVASKSLKRRVVLSRPPHGKGGSRVIGLWKDVNTGDPVPIELPVGADAVVLSLAVHYGTEWRADGRGDPNASGYPVFGGVHPVFLPSST